MRARFPFYVLRAMTAGQSPGAVTGGGGLSFVKAGLRASAKISLKKKLPVLEEVDSNF